MDRLRSPTIAAHRAGKRSPGGTEPAARRSPRGIPRSVDPADRWAMVRAVTRRDRLEGRPSMDRSNGGDQRAAAVSPEAEALDFVRFCHRRKRVGWPELYDEMCAVAGKGLYRGYGPEGLGQIGTGLGPFARAGL